MASDLISRDALIKDMYEDGYFSLTVADKATEKVMAQPTVDAVEVVRCENCEYFITDTFKRTMCNRTFTMFEMKPEDFCSYGTKR